jgi:aminopeptidase N
MQIAATEGPKLLGLLESYLGIAYPFEKLDLLACPLESGAMENAGLIIQDDTLMLLDADAPLSQLRDFGEVTAHEMAHQWFGDLVTPAWWTDIWLNESFAEWMGKKISHQWRPELGIAASELKYAFEAMDTDSLSEGRPIRQPILENRQIVSAFDSITYEKGAQVVSMFESYLGAEKFAKGVHQHLQRYRHGNATAEDFFRSLGGAAGDSMIVAAMRTFTDQTGVPVVSFAPGGQGLAVTQTRYRPLGVKPAPAQTWMIPLCVTADSQRSCTLLDKPSAALPPSGAQLLVPNAGGAGYYRFRLDAAGWDRLIAAAPTLPGPEALALADSLWADFAAGTGRFEKVIAAARALSTNPERLAVIELGERLKQLADTALTPEQVPQYRRVMQSIYGPRLAALGVDVRRGAYAQDSAAKQALRQELVPLVALDARDADLRARLVAAGVAALDGDASAIDPAFRAAALSAAVQDRGVPFMQKLRDALVKSTDPLFRLQACKAIGSADTPALAETAADLAFSDGVQSIETVSILLQLSHQRGARASIKQLVDKDFKRVIEAFPGFARPMVVHVFDGYCSPGDIEKVNAFMQPKLRTLGGGELELAQVQERIGLCVALREAKGAEIGAALSKAAM